MICAQASSFVLLGLMSSVLYSSKFDALLMALRTRACPDACHIRQIYECECHFCSAMSCDLKGDLYSGTAGFTFHACTSGYVYSYISMQNS